MNATDTHDTLTWLVLQNDAGQYSLWPACRPVPAGWNEAGPEGDVDTCTAWVDNHWKNLRSASV